MLQRTLSADRHALLTVDEMYRADRAAMAAGVPSLDLMEAAGAAAAGEIQRRWSARPVTVLCGPGNNGGDGFVVARHLASAGWPVRLALLGEVTALRGDAAVNAQRWTAPVEPADERCLDGARLVVDALFGAGLGRPLDGAARDLVRAIELRAIPCVGVDVPSGVHGDSGAVLGAAPHCALTVTFFRRKPGHLLLPGRDRCGEVIVADIGIPAGVLDGIAPATFANHPDLWRDLMPRPGVGDNKFRRGHAVVWGGSQMTGAARLAARAARRVGAGLVTIAAHPDVFAIYAGDTPGNLIMPVVEDADFRELMTDERRNAVLVGPGAGVNEETRQRVLAALEAEKACVLDADGLTVFRDDPNELFDAVGAACVMTPHEGEFARLFAVEGDKPARARAAAAESGAVVLLKGADTVIAAPDGRAAINANAPPELATAGSGDVLAGLILGLLTQGMPPYEAACAAAWMHGAAAAAFGPGLIAEDLPESLPAVLRGLRDSRTTVDGNETR